MTIADIEDLARRGESASIEFKRSTGQRRRLVSDWLVRNNEAEWGGLTALFRLIRDAGSAVSEIEDRLAAF